MIVYITENTTSTPLIIGQIHVIDPDVNENFTITFNNPNFQSLIPANDAYSLISDEGSVVYVWQVFY